MKPRRIKAPRFIKSWLLIFRSLKVHAFSEIIGILLFIFFVQATEPWISIVALVHPDSAAYRGRPRVPHTIVDLYLPMHRIGIICKT